MNRTDAPSGLPFGPADDALTLSVKTAFVAFSRAIKGWIANEFDDRELARQVLGEMKREAAAAAEGSREGASPIQSTTPAQTLPPSPPPLKST